MTIHIIPIWKDHDIIVFKVKRWRPIYRYFNMIFARATHRVEMMIDDGTTIKV